MSWQQTITTMTNVTIVTTTVATRPLKRLETHHLHLEPLVCFFFFAHLFQYTNDYYFLTDLYCQQTTTTTAATTTTNVMLLPPPTKESRDADASQASGMFFFLVHFLI